jgi:hypothetical protein
MRTNLLPVGVIVGLSAIFTAGCSDKELAKEVAALREEVALMKSEKGAKVAELVFELEKAKEGTQKAIDRLSSGLDAIKQANQLVEKQLDVLSKNNADFDKVTERLDKLVNALPLPQLTAWKDQGSLACKELSVINLSSTSHLAINANQLAFSDDTGAGVTITPKGVLAQTKDGYLAGILTTEEGAELTVVGKNGSYAKIAAAALVTGVKVGGADEDPQIGFLGKMDKTGEIFLNIDGEKTGTLVTSGQLSLKKKDQNVVSLAVTGRGGSLSIFDDIGTKPRIRMGLRGDNGEPIVTVLGATQLNYLMPKFNYPQETE